MRLPREPGCRAHDVVISALNLIGEALHVRGETADHKRADAERNNQEAAKTSELIPHRGFSGIRATTQAAIVLTKDADKERYRS